MRYFIILLVILLASSCYADVKLWRYTDKASGDERGIEYSKTARDNPTWNAAQITEAQKGQYIELQKKQISDKEKDVDQQKKDNRNTAKQELRGLGLSEKAIKGIFQEI